MKLNIFKYLFILFLSGFLFSCSDDYLTESDPNMLSVDIYWRDLRDTETGLTATYASLLNHYILNLSAEGCRADLGWPGFGRPEPNGRGAVQWYYHTYTNTTEAVERKWQACYLGIFRANQVIEGLESFRSFIAEEDETEWRQQMGEARFIRGLLHFYLYQSFNEGSIIIRDKVPQTQADFNKGLSPASEVLTFVREDFRYAHKNLAPKYTDPGDLGRASAGAAATLLGNSFLFEAEYDSAMVYYRDVMNNKEYGYKLETDLDKMFTMAGELNDESIFEICYNTEFRAELNQWNEESMHNRLVNEMSGNIGANTAAWLTYAYKTEQKDPKDVRNYYMNESNSSVLRNVPLRASSMVTLIEDEQTEYYDGIVPENGRFGGDSWGFSESKKYTNHDHLNEEDESGGSSWISGKNVVVNRLSEVYINMAECVIKTGGDVQVALDYINKIRARWGLVLLGQPNGDLSHTYDGIDYTREELMDRIMYVEKPLELSNEGHMIRWIDMRRWGITADRFQELSEEVYYCIDYEFIQSDGTPKTQKYSSLVTTVPPGYDKREPLVIDYEYEEAAVNYVPSVHDYFGIPSNETIANSNLNE